MACVCALDGWKDESHRQKCVTFDFTSMPSRCDIIADAFDEEDNLPNFERVFTSSWDVTFSQISIRFLVDLTGIGMIMAFDIIGL